MEQCSSSSTRWPSVVTFCPINSSNKIRWDKTVLILKKEILVPEILKKMDSKSKLEPEDDCQFCLNSC